MDKKRRIAKDYDETAKDYDRRYSEIQREKFKILDGLNAKYTKGIILDHGCGSGLLAKHLNKRLQGCDLSFAMCKLASAHEDVACCDIDSLPYKSHSADAIFSFTAVQNLPDFSKVFKEARRVLKKSGLFVCSVLNKVDLAELRREAKLAGFSIKSESSCGEDVQFIFC